MHRRLGPAALSLLYSLTLSAEPARAVDLHPGDILVSGGTFVSSFIARVDPVTGAQTMVSQGGLVGGCCLAVGDDGFIYVGTGTAGPISTILRVDPSDGSQAIFASPPASMNFFFPSSMFAHTNGNIYYSGGNNGDIIEMVLPGGALTKLTTDAFLANITEGPDGAIYGSTCREADLQTACGGDGTNDVVALRHVIGSGSVTAAGLGPIRKPLGIAFDRRDSMYVESQDDNRVFRFGPGGNSGALTGSELTYTATKMVGHPDGNLYMTHNYFALGGRVDRLDPVTGIRTTLSDFGAAGAGAVFGITVVGDRTTPTRRKRWGQVKQIYR